MQKELAVAYSSVQSNWDKVIFKAVIDFLLGILLCRLYILL